MKDDHFESRNTIPTSIPTTPSSLPGGKQRRKAMNPIIMLSPSETALLNLHNVKKFLEESMLVQIFNHKASSHFQSLRTCTDFFVSLCVNYRYVEPIQAKRENDNPTTDMVMIHHARTTTTISSSINKNDYNQLNAAKGSRYFIVNSVEALAKFGSLDDAWYV